MRRTVLFAVLSSLGLLLPAASQEVADLEPGQVRLSWMAPTLNEDGTPLTDLAGYRLYSGCEQSGQYERPAIEIANPAVLSYVVEDLPEGATCYFVATSYNAGGVQSRFSGEASKIVPSGPIPYPAPAENLDISWSESTGEPPMALDDSGLLVRYYADEAATGEVPTDLLDASGVGDAEDLPIIYGTNLNYIEVSGNRGLTSSDDNGNGIAQSGVLTAGNKIFDALEGSTTATLEYVVDISAYNTGGGRLFGLMNGNTGNGTFLMVGDSFGGTNAEIRVNNSTRTSDVGTITGKAVIHIVMDSTQASGGDRLKLYINGVRQVGINATLPINTTLSFATTRLVVMNRPSQNRAVEGTFFYGALYSDAFDDARVVAHQSPISTDDDTPSGAGVAVNQASETDTALPITAPKDVAVGLASELDTAQPISSFTPIELGLASETDTAQPLGSAKAQTIGLTTEADTALPVDSLKETAIGLTQETDTALPMTAGVVTNVPVGQVLETDSALPFDGAKQAELGQASEADSARPITVVSGEFIIPVGIASELDTALGFDSSKDRAFGLATETDSALEITAGRGFDLGIATETDSALPWSAEKILEVGQALETDTALPITLAGPIVVPIGLAQELDSALPMTVGGIETDVDTGGASYGRGDRHKRSRKAQPRKKPPGYRRFGELAKILARKHQEKIQQIAQEQPDQTIDELTTQAIDEVLEISGAYNSLAQVVAAVPEATSIEDGREGMREVFADAVAEARDESDLIELAMLALREDEAGLKL